MLSIDAASNRERAAVAAFQRLPRELQKDLRTRTRAEVVPLVVREVTAQADTATMRAIARSGRGGEYRGVPDVRFGGSRAVTSDGTPGRVLVRGLEYGSPGRWVNLVTARSPRGRSYSYARRTTAQFTPDRSSNPTAVTPAVERVTDEVLALWVGLVEDAAVAAFDGEA